MGLCRKYCYDRPFYGSALADYSYRTVGRGQFFPSLCDRFCSAYFLADVHSHRHEFGGLAYHGASFAVRFLRRFKFGDAFSRDGDSAEYKDKLAEGDRIAGS